VDRFCPPSFWWVRIVCEKLLIASSCPFSVLLIVLVPLPLGGLTIIFYAGCLLSKSVEKLQISVKSQKLSIILHKDSYTCCFFLLSHKFVCAPLNIMMVPRKPHSDRLDVCIETNLIHYLSSVYSVTLTLHVSSLLVAHHQEVKIRQSHYRP
jgi:hypothetical protein